MPDVVLLYAPPWAGPTRFSKHHLASYFARRGARVLYVEAPLTPMGLRRGRHFLAELRDTIQAPHPVHERLLVRRHFLPVPYHAASSLTSRRAANVVGQRLLAPVVRRDLRRLGMRQPIIIAGLPHAADIVAFLPRRLLIYHCADDYAHVRGFPASLPSVEADLCRHADLVITTSETLCETRRQWNPDTHWIPNGADIAHFSRSPSMPAESALNNVGRPVVGFVGGLSEWVDVELLASLARQRPSWSFVLVGPASIDLSPLRSLPNVHLLGPRPYAELPGYLAAMDVALIPFKHNDVSFHADPIKAYEYLAAGVPVVATDLPALRRLGHVVRLADSPERFLSEIDAAVAEGRDLRRTERQAEAARHSWDARFAVLEQLICQRVPCGF